MAQTSSLGFAPILHNITPDRVVFCYREGDPYDTDSLEVAVHYRDSRGVPPENLIALPCSKDNIITEAEYVETIEKPIRDGIAALAGASSAAVSAGREIWVIILGYQVPHGYYLGSDPYGEIIAIASRLHLLDKPFQTKKSNYTYDRRGDWQYFDMNDAQNFYLTAVIDGPTKEAALTLVDRSIDVDNQIFVAGKIFVDPYGRKLTTNQIDYQDDIIEFIDNELPNLGLESSITVDIEDPYQQPSVKRLERDSFYWGWSTSEYSKDLFLNQNERRVFLYNADDSAAENISSGFDELNGSDKWCTLAINVQPGYAACAGAIAMTPEDTFLRPRPFFESLHRGASLGESFLFACPFISNKIILIGDPLLVVNFPSNLPLDQEVSDVNISTTSNIELAESQGIPVDEGSVQVRIETSFSDVQVGGLENDEAIRLIKEVLEETVAYAVRQSNLIQTTLDKNVQSSNLSEELALLAPLAFWRDSKNVDSRNNLFSLPISSWLTYIISSTGLELNGWLIDREEKISSLLSDTIKVIASANINSDLIHPEGHWQYDFTYMHELTTFESIHFRLQLANDSSFSDVVVDVNSLSSSIGWKYENESNAFVQLPGTGFPSNFSGRRTRYVATANDFLTRTNLYYVRWKALHDNGTDITDWVVDSTPLIVKR